MNEWTDCDGYYDCDATPTRLSILKILEVDVAVSGLASGLLLQATVSVEEGAHSVGRQILAPQITEDNLSRVINTWKQARPIEKLTKTIAAILLRLSLFSTGGSSSSGSDPTTGRSSSRAEAVRSGVSAQHVVGCYRAGN